MPDDVPQLDRIGNPLPLRIPHTGFNQEPPQFEIVDFILRNRSLLLGMVKQDLGDLDPLRRVIVDRLPALEDQRGEILRRGELGQNVDLPRSPAIADKYSIDMSKLLDAIALSDTEKQDEAFEELLVDVSERDRSKIYALAEKLPAIMERRNELYSKREEALAELEAKKTAAEQATALERAKERKAAVELVVKRVSDKLPFLKSESFSLDPVKTAVAETDFDAADTTVKAYNAVAGQLVPHLYLHLR